jgi:hypothetical protein
LSWLAQKFKKTYCLGALVPSIGAGLEVLLPEVPLPPEVPEEPPMPDFGGSPQADNSSAKVAAVAAKATGLNALDLRGEDAFCVDVFCMKEPF